MVISDAEYESRTRRMRRERPVLRADLRLFATIGRVALGHPERAWIPLDALNRRELTATSDTLQDYS